MMLRLETVAKYLSEKLKTASSEKQRIVGLLACRLALQTAPVESDIVLDALNQLQKYGGLPPQLITKLNKLASQLDERYFDMQDQAESDPNIQIEALYLFSQARAVSALSFAGGSDPLVAGMEAIYEASTTDDGNKIFSAVLEILS